MHRELSFTERTLFAAGVIALIIAFVLNKLLPYAVTAAICFAVCGMVVLAVYGVLFLVKATRQVFSLIRKGTNATATITEIRRGKLNIYYSLSYCDELNNEYNQQSLRILSSFGLGIGSNMQVKYKTDKPDEFIVVPSDYRMLALYYLFAVIIAAVAVGFFLM